jgi:hypothetical protein
MQWFKDLNSRAKAAVIIIAGALIVLLAVVLISSTQDEVYVQPPEVVKPEEEQEPDDNLTRPGAGGGRVGGVLVTPSAQELINVSVGTRIDPVTIINNANIRVRVDVDYVPMRGNSLIGAPEYDVTPETIAAGRQQIRPDIRSFVLLPGAEKSVGATIVGEPEDGQRGLYGVLVFRTDSIRKNEVSDPIKGGVRLSVNQTYSIGAIVLARFAGPVRKSFRLQQIRLKQTDDGDYQVQARVRNDGNYVESTSGDVVISRNPDGRVVETIELNESQGIFPDDNRDLIGSQPGLRLPAGDYTATARVAGQQRSWAFRIDEQGNLPTPQGVFEVIPDPGRPLPNQNFQATVQLLNNGQVDLQAAGEVLLYRYGVDRVLQRQRVNIGPIGPGDIATEVVNFRGLPEEGNYELVLELQTADDLAIGQKTVNIAVDDRQVEQPGLYDRIRDWMSANPLLTLLAGAALIALLFGMLFAFLSRPKKEQ